MAVAYSRLVETDTEFTRQINSSGRFSAAAAAAMMTTTTASLDTATVTAHSRQRSEIWPAVMRVVIELSCSYHDEATLITTRSGTDTHPSNDFR